MIFAQKNGLKKRFSAIAWELMGQNKNGWVEDSTQTTDSVIAKTSAIQTPPTGQKETQTVQVVENVVAPVTEVTNLVENVVVGTPAVNTVNNDTDPFITLAKESLSKNKIKDFFDSETENVAYKSSDNTDTLIGLLAKHLNNDIELLKSKFSL